MCFSFIVTTHYEKYLYTKFISISYNLIPDKKGDATRQMNFSASFLSFMNKKIFDELGHPIDTVSYETKKYPLSYHKPYIEFDILKKEKILKEPIIKNIREFKNVEESLGFIVISVPISPGEKWFKGQRVMYLLVRKNSYEATKYRRTNYIEASKGQHYCEYDSANNRVRLVGAKAGRAGAGPWLEIND